MFKNVASQKIKLFAFDATTGLPKTGDAANITAYVSKDNGTVTILGDTSATEMSSTLAKGWYMFDLTQAETNGDSLLFTANSTTSNIVVTASEFSTLPPNFSSLVINSAGAVSIQSVLKKSAGLNNFHFLMTDSTAHNPATGKTVTATRVLDSGAFGAGTLSSVTEVAGGIYRVDLATGDMNGNVVTLKLSASGCDDLFITLTLEP